MFGRLPERGSEIPICPSCESHFVEGHSRRIDDGPQFMQWQCNECDHQFEVIEVEDTDNSMSARRARKRWWMSGGRQR